jgi:hypothetical protein
MISSLAKIADNLVNHESIPEIVVSLAFQKLMSRAPIKHKIQGRQPKN